MGTELTPFGSNNGVVPYEGNTGVANYVGGSPPHSSGQSVAQSQDAALFESFAQSLAQHGITGVHQHRTMQAAQQWYTEFARRSEAQETAMHERHMQACTRELKSDWGPDYAANMRMLHGFLDSLPAQSKELFLEARGDDRSALANNAPLLKALVGLIRGERFSGRPGAGRVQSGQRTITEGSETFEQLESMVQDRGSRYYRGSTAERNRLSQRYLELLKQRNGEDDE